MLRFFAQEIHSQRARHWRLGRCFANDTQLNAGAGGDLIVTVDLTAGSFSYPNNAKLPASCIYVGPNTGSAPTPLSNANPLPCAIVSALPAGSSVIGAVTQSGGPWTINVTQIGGSALAIGQAAMAASIPVVIASNQSALPVSQSGTWSVGLSAGSNTIGAVTQASGPWTINVTQIGGSALSLGQKAMASSLPVTIASDQPAFPVTQSGTWTVGLSTGSSLIGHVDGSVASGAANANNPVKTGGVFNSTQPTVTTGQVVDAQYSARGAALVATGVDVFNVTVNTALPTGSNTIGAVQQAGTWTIATNADSSVGAGAAPSKSLLVAGIFNSTLPTLSSGQVAGLQVDASGRLLVNVAVNSGGGGSGGTSATDEASFTAGTTAGTPVEGVFNDGLAAVSSGQIAVGRITSNRGLHVNLRNNSGTEIGTAATAVRIDPVGTTAQPVTQSAGPWTVNGPVASGATNANNPVKTGGVFNTTQPTVTNGQIDDSQYTAHGAAIVATGTDTFNVTVNTALPTGSNVIGAVTQSGTWNVTVNAALPTGSNVIGAVTQSGTWNVTVNTALPAGTNNIGLVTAVGAAASGSAKSGNPVQIGGVFNSTQPTVTTGQMVEGQYTARGAAIVATGVDTFNVTVNAALPAGGNTIGAVNQAGTWNVGLSAGSNLIGHVDGSVASGSANANNPVKVGGVFNSTQPTVTNGQIVDGQYSARGAAIVATGVDAFNVTVTTALPAGGNTIGAVNQAGSWNVGQSGTWNVGLSAGSNLIGHVDGPVASGGTNANNPVKVGGVFNSTQPTVTTGQVVVGPFTAQGAAIVATGVDTFNVAVNAALPTGSNVIGAVTQSGTWNVGQSGTWTVGLSAGTNLIGHVDGPVASGAANANNPVKVGGVFNSTQPTVTNGQVVDAQCTARGAQIVATGADTFNVTVNAALPAGSNVIGAVTQSGTWTVATNADAAVGAGSAPSKALLIAGVFNSSAPSLSNGQTAAVQFDSSGNLKVNIAAGSNVGGTSAADGAAFTAGTTAGTSVQGVFNDGLSAVSSGTVDTARITNNRALHVNIRNQAGTELATQAAPLRIDPVGTTTQPVTVADRTQLTQSLVMSSTTNAVSLATPGTSTVSVQITGSWTGTIIFEGTNDGTNWFSLQALTPTTGVLSSTITANGNWYISSAGLAQVRTRCSVTGTGTATVTINASIGDGNVLVAPLPTGSNVIGAVTQSGGPWSVSFTSAVTPNDRTNLTQSLSLAATTNNVALTAPGTGTATVQITGSWSGTLIFEATTDGSNWFTISGVVPGTGALATTTTANGSWIVPCAGYAQIRVRCSVVGSSTATVSIEASAGCQAVSLANPAPTLADAAVGVGTAPTKCHVSGAQFNSTPPAPANQQTVSLQCSSSGALFVSTEGTKQSYSACSGIFTPASLATDFATLAGASGKTTKVWRIKLQFVTTTANPGAVQVALLLRTSVNSGGTSTVGNGARRNNTNNSLPGATPAFYTANPTGLGSAATFFSDVYVPIMVTNTGNPTLQQYVWDYTRNGLQPPTLQGVSNLLCLSLLGVSLPASSFALVEFEWTEE